MEGSIGSKSTSFDDLRRATNEILPLVEAEADEAERLERLVLIFVAATGDRETRSLGRNDLELGQYFPLHA